MRKRYLFAEHNIDEDDLRDLAEWLKGGPWLTKGPVTAEFERRWAEWLGVGHAAFVNSGSSANLLAYYALLLSDRLKNRKVVVPSVSWSTTVAPAVQLGFEPIMCEADEATLGLDAAYLEALVERHDPAAVVVCHVLGVPSDMEPLLELKQRYGFLLLEDACQAIGSRYDGKLLGTFGDVSTFSFFYSHHLTTIEGGMVCAQDEELHDLILQLRSHGWAKDLPRDKEARLAQSSGVEDFRRPFTFYHPGFNVRSTELNARIGLSQMSKLDNFIKRRIENHHLYESRFSKAPGFRCQRNERAVSCSISFGLLASSPGHRERVARALDSKGIETRPLGGGNMSRQPFWADRFGATDFAVADRVHETGLLLPNHPHLGPEDVEFISDAVLAVEADPGA